MTDEEAMEVELKIYDYLPEELRALFYERIKHEYNVGYDAGYLDSAEYDIRANQQ